MRTELEMISLIKYLALKDENVRAAYLEGSRANPRIPKDIFQDYDVVYIVNSTKPYREDKKWIMQFGEILYMQYPEDSVLYPSDIKNYYGWLVQFKDGNRLDLHVSTKEYALSHLELYQILLDKDGILPSPRETTDQRYWIKRPCEAEFESACSEFWWSLNNIAKGLWRDEIPYVMDMINLVSRPQLIQLLNWKIGFETNFSVSTGKSSKYMKNYLTQTEYNRFLKTFSSAEAESIWVSVFEMCDLFQFAAEQVSNLANFSLDRTLTENSLSYLKHIHMLPHDAKEVY